MNKKLYALRTEDGKVLRNTIVEEIGTTDDLYSYETLVCSVHAGSAFIVFTDAWNYSATTLKHVKTFLKNELNLNGLTKKNIQKMIDAGKVEVNMYNTVFDVKKEAL